jgi:hypothetical protein
MVQWYFPFSIPCLLQHIFSYRIGSNVEDVAEVDKIFETRQKLAEEFFKDEEEEEETKTPEVDREEKSVEEKLPETEVDSDKTGTAQEKSDEQVPTLFSSWPTKRQIQECLSPASLFSLVWLGVGNGDNRTVRLKSM